MGQISYNLQAGAPAEAGLDTGAGAKSEAGEGGGPQGDQAWRVATPNHLLRRPPQTHYIQQHIEFKSIKRGSFFASRVLIDEAITKNYIKAHKAQILRWIREPYQNKIQSIIRRFTVQQSLLGSEPQGPHKGSLSRHQKYLKAKLVSLKQGFELKSETQTRKEHQFDADGPGEKSARDSAQEPEEAEDSEQAQAASK